MKTIKWHVSMSLVGCTRSGEIEVDDDATDEEIDDLFKKLSSISFRGDGSPSHDG